jgi:hypothetical protein
LVWDKPAKDPAVAADICATRRLRVNELVAAMDLAVAVPVVVKPGAPTANQLDEPIIGIAIRISSAPN